MTRGLSSAGGPARALVGRRRRDSHGALPAGGGAVGAAAGQQPPGPAGGQRARQQHGHGAVHGGPVLAGRPGPGHQRRHGGGAGQTGVKEEKLRWGAGTGESLGQDAWLPPGSEESGPPAHSAALPPQLLWFC